MQVYAAFDGSRIKILPGSTPGRVGFVRERDVFKQRQKTEYLKSVVYKSRGERSQVYAAEYIREVDKLNMLEKMAEPYRALFN